MATDRLVLAWNADLAFCDVGTNKLSPDSDAARARSQARLQILDDLLDTTDLDFVSLQEIGQTYKKQVRTLLRRNGFKPHWHEGLVVGYRSTRWSQKGTVWSWKNRAFGVKLTSATQTLYFYGVHLRSTFMSTQFVQDDLGGQVAEKIRDRRKHYSFERAAEEIIAGDFNADPFWTVLREQRGFFANRCPGLVRLHREDLPNRPFYNPSWRGLGRFTVPRGSYYMGGAIDGPWYVFDQVLLTHGLVPPVNEYRIVTEVNGVDLTRRDTKAPRRETASDHFPILTRVRV